LKEKEKRMGLFSDWLSRNPGKQNFLVTAEFVLKLLEEQTKKVDSCPVPVGGQYIQ
jgi:hypothetical protein